MCCSPWGRKESDKTEQLNNNKSHTSIYPNLIIHIQTVYHLFGSSFPLYLHYHVLPFHSLYLLLLLSHFSCVRLCVTPQTAAHQASPSLRFFFLHPPHFASLGSPAISPLFSTSLTPVLLHFATCFPSWPSFFPHLCSPSTLWVTPHLLQLNFLPLHSLAP